MTRTLLIAFREFCSVVLTKGFLIGVLMTPVMLAIVAGAMFLLKNQTGPRTEGVVAVLDKSAAAGDFLKTRFDDSADKAEQEAKLKQVNKAIDQATKQFNLPQNAVDEAKKSPQAQMALNQGDGTQLTLNVLPPDADIEKLKSQVAIAKVKSAGQKGGEQSGASQTIAFAVIPDSSVRPGPDAAYSNYELFVAPKLDFEVQRKIERRISQAIIDARIATDSRVQSSGMDGKGLRALLDTPESKTVTVSASGERSSIGPLQFLVPMAFMILLLISVLTSGQYLMTTVVEEKSSRVMEVLLSAVSPMQLMVGKILGHMTVGLLIMVVYGGLGIAGLIVSALTDLVSPMTLVLLMIYFFIAAFTVSSVMAAIGAAVNELREAQTLLTPVMMVIMLPWLLWMPIQRAPNSTFATVLSFVPGLNPFIMAIRLGGSEPVPTWQIPVSILIGLLTVCFCAWAAAKIFRVGVLMYGKPPNFRTLVKWVRMA